MSNFKRLQQKRFLRGLVVLWYHWPTAVTDLWHRQQIFSRVGFVGSKNWMEKRRLCFFCFFSRWLGGFCLMFFWCGIYQCFLCVKTQFCLFEFLGLKLGEEIWNKTARSVLIIIKQRGEINSKRLILSKDEETETSFVVCVEHGRKETCALECWEECLCLVKIVGNSRNLSIYVYNFIFIFLSFLSTYIPLVLKVVFQTSKVELVVGSMKRLPTPR